MSKNAGHYYGTLKGGVFNTISRMKFVTLSLALLYLVNDYAVNCCHLSA